MPPTSPTALTINTVGESSISHAAERATLHISIYSQGPSQDTVSEDVANTAATIRPMLESMISPMLKDTTSSSSSTLSAPSPTKPVTNWSSSSLSTGFYLHYPVARPAHEGPQPATTVVYRSAVPLPPPQPQPDPEPPQPVRIFRATQTIQATFGHFPALGPFATTLSTLPHVSIDNVSWDLTPTTRANLSTQSRRNAVGDAVRRAQDLADGLAYATTTTTDSSSSSRGAITCVEIKESGASPHYFGVSRGAPGGAAVRMRSQAQMAEPARQELVFEPEEVQVRCSVEARFEVVQQS